MATLPDVIPDPNDLLAMEVEDLAPIILRLVKDQRSGSGMVHMQSVVNVSIHQNHAYVHPVKQRVDMHIAAAWDWLRTNGLLAPAPDINGSNGWMIITAKGEAAVTEQDFARLKMAMAFPKELLHPDIRDKVWKALARGDLDEAVFAAFKAVEVGVRGKGGFLATDIGMPLMRKAFDPNTGTLSNMDHPFSEREALAHLFAGAIGSYKNPHSHRTVALTDPREAQEQCLLASHLLSIVEARAQR